MASGKAAGRWTRLRADLEAGSSSREVRIRVPFFLWSFVVRKPFPQKKGKRALLRELGSTSSHHRGLSISQVDAIRMAVAGQGLSR